MNIDVANHPGFSAYVLLLMLSGLVMVFLAGPAVRQSKVWRRRRRPPSRRRRPLSATAG